jgi:hypothetical protein
MNTRNLFLLSALCSLSSLAADWTVSIDPSVRLGAIKPVNAVNCGPCNPNSAQGKAYKAANIPFARTHDMNHSWTYGGPYIIDISAIFPNFDADETNSENYDFALTDRALDWMFKAGTKPFFRLGQSIEPWGKTYHVNPPKDYAKWARICEHIIAHYTEEWAQGKKWDIKYWEIWNEPDLDKKTWTGTKEDFFEFFKVTLKHLKARFPNLKIGGPAMAHPFRWKDFFIPACAKENLPLDFYSWHRYCNDARESSRYGREVREYLDKYGYKKTESIYNEWNYVKGWRGGDWRYSRQVESSVFNQKAAAFAAATMIECQNSPIDMAMYYDVRTYGGMNMLFDSITHQPLRGYYPFYAWGRMLKDYPEQIKCTLVPNGDKLNDLFAVAARSKSGKIAIYLARYTDDNNVRNDITIRLNLPKAEHYRCHLTDDWRIYTEFPLETTSDGAIELMLVPSSFVFIEVGM